MDIERVKDIRTAIATAIREPLHSGDPERVGEVFYACAQIVAGATVREAGGDMDLAERLFLGFCQHVMLLIPDFELTRAAHTPPPVQEQVNQ